MVTPANHPSVLNVAAGSPLSFGAAVDEENFRRIRDRLSLECCKWDSQIGDISTLFPQPLLISSETWQDLRQMAEDLAAELASAELELLGRPDLYPGLGLPWPLRSALDEARRFGPTPSAVRTLRFDFHYTTEGWRISEVNSDVPGGYTEASCFTESMADCFFRTTPTGNPANEWTDAMSSVVGPGSAVVLLSAPGFLEDQQVTAFLAGRLEQRGLETFLLHDPAQLTWKSGKASVLLKQKQIYVDAIVRFYQGEWLAKLPRHCGWKFLFSHGTTPVTNPGVALLTESKRFPLVWDKLTNNMNRWRTLLPECRDPADLEWQQQDEWVLKRAFSNTGDAVYMRNSMDRREWTQLYGVVKRHPEDWVIQRRFETLPVASDTGALYPCVGVYTVNGRAAGVYARAAATPVIDYAAMDVALLIDEKKC